VFDQPLILFSLPYPPADSLPHASPLSIFEVH
jgi:hypothetical protein